MFNLLESIVEKEASQVDNPTRTEQFKSTSEITPLNVLDTIMKTELNRKPRSPVTEAPLNIVPSTVSDDTYPPYACTIIKWIVLAVVILEFLLCLLIVILLLLIVFPLPTIDIFVN